jgi:hypothetical protein
MGLIRAVYTRSQLESRLGASGKVSARFLLQLNVLDELGSQPAVTSGADYAGNPHLARYVQFDETLRQLGIASAQANAYVPFAAASACRAALENNYDDHASMVTVLVVSETVFMRFCCPWAKCVGAKAGIDVPPANEPPSHYAEQAVAPPASAAAYRPVRERGSGAAPSAGSSSGVGHFLLQQQRWVLIR